MRALRTTVSASLLLILTCAQAQTNVTFTRTEDVIYGRKFGTALTLDVFQPQQANGAAIIQLVSGGWFSSHDNINPQRLQPFLNRGYTVFAVVHGSQPKFVVQEIVQDIHRAVRFIRHNAARYGVDPDRFGVIGSSAGGHLSLTIGTQGSPGNAAAKDPVNRQSSAVQCVACFFPATDFLNYSRPGEDAVGVGTLASFKPGFGPRSDTPDGRQELGREISPIYFVHSNQPPILILHGDADKLVPIYQSQMFVQRCAEAGAKARLEVREGKGHGWPDMVKDVEVCADWFDQHLGYRTAQAPGAAQVLFADDFQGKLGAGWSWVREHPEAWRATERGLEVRIEPGNMWGAKNDARNVLVRPAPEPVDPGLDISVNVENKPTSQYEQVDLVWYYDDGHMVKLGQELVNGQLSVVMGREEGDKARTVKIIPLDSTELRLRFLVSSNAIRGQFRTPGAAEWTEVGECDLPAPKDGKPHISLQFYQGPADAEHWARVTGFSITR